MSDLFGDREDRLSRVVALIPVIIFSKRQLKTLISVKHYHTLCFMFQNHILRLKVLV